MSGYGARGGFAGRGGGGFNHGGGGGRGGGGGYRALVNPLADVKLSAPDFANAPEMVVTTYESKQKLDVGTVQAWRQEHNIACEAQGQVLDPILSFDEFHCPEEIKYSFQEQGYKTPTPIQSQCWPILLSGQDLVGVAKTGSGKTMTYMVPAVVHIMAQQPPLRREDGPMALVLAPTRELACQIEEESRKVVKHLPYLRTAVCYGGMGTKYSQAAVLRRGVHVCIATPGRLIDLMKMGATNLLRTTYLVLDEADRMLDMGFEPQLKEIFSQVRTERQTVMFSATWPREIRSMASQFMRNFTRINVGGDELVCNKDVIQNIAVVNFHQRLGRIMEIMKQHGSTRYLIFTKTKKSADDLGWYLAEELKKIETQGHQKPFAMVLHGDKEQRERDRWLERFRQDSSSILIATDVACRGLDIEGLDVVINYEMPKNVEDFVHRVGRTGRAGKTGHAYSFLGSDTETARYYRELRNVLFRSGATIPEDLDRLAGPQRRERGGRGGYGQQGGYNNNYGEYNRQPYVRQPAQPIMYGNQSLQNNSGTEPSSPATQRASFSPTGHGEAFPDNRKRDNGAAYGVPKKPQYQSPASHKTFADSDSD